MDAMATTDAVCVAGALKRKLATQPSRHDKPHNWLIEKLEYDFLTKQAVANLEGFEARSCAVGGKVTTMTPQKLQALSAQVTGFHAKNRNGTVVYDVARSNGFPDIFVKLIDVRKSHEKQDLTEGVVEAVNMLTAAKLQFGVGVIGCWISSWEQLKLRTDYEPETPDDDVSACMVICTERCIGYPAMMECHSDIPGLLRQAVEHACSYAILADLKVDNIVFDPLRQKICIIDIDACFSHLFSESDCRSAIVVSLCTMLSERVRKSGEKDDTPCVSEQDLALLQPVARLLRDVMLEEWCTGVCKELSGKAFKELADKIDEDSEDGKLARFINPIKHYMNRRSAVWNWKYMHAPAEEWIEVLSRELTTIFLTQPNDGTKHMRYVGIV